MIGDILQILKDLLKIAFLLFLFDYIGTFLLNSIGFFFYSLYSGISVFFFYFCSSFTINLLFGFFKIFIIFACLRFFYRIFKM